MVPLPRLAVLGLAGFALAFGSGCQSGSGEVARQSNVSFESAPGGGSGQHAYTDAGPSYRNPPPGSSCSSGGCGSGGCGSGGCGSGGGGRRTYANSGSSYRAPAGSSGRGSGSCCTSDGQRAYTGPGPSGRFQEGAASNAPQSIAGRPSELPAPWIASPAPAPPVAFRERSFSNSPAAGQQNCPVTGEPLGSMGGAIPVAVRGQTVYVCCQGCVAPVKKNPEKYLAIVQREISQQR